MTSPCIQYVPREDVTPEAECSALANVYRHVLDCHAKKRRPPKAAPKMRGRIKMLAPALIVHDAPFLLGDVRAALSLRPALADYPRRLAEHLEAEEQAVRECLEALRAEDEVLA